MSFIAIDNPDAVIDWFAVYPEAERQRRVIGPCPHACPHNMTATVGWGPDLAHYELQRCDVADGCNRNCRAWLAVEKSGRELWGDIEWRLLS
jgi:hypothetical protein